MNLKLMLRAAIFAAITAVLSQIIIPVGVVPITLSYVAVFLCGGLLPPKWTVFAQCLYLLLGAVGAPVFSGMQGGIGKLVGPTGGYLIAYPIMAGGIAYLMQKRVNIFLALLCANIAGYALGTSWLAWSQNLSVYKAFLVGVAPFALIDLVKIAVTGIITQQISKKVGVLNEQKN